MKHFDRIGEIDVDGYGNLIVELLMASQKAVINASAHKVYKVRAGSLADSGRWVVVEMQPNSPPYERTVMETNSKAIAVRMAIELNNEVER
jgi:hypothetical protein